MPRSPSPLKVEAAQPARDIGHLANEIQTGNPPRFHRLRRKLAGVHAPQRHFRRGVSLGAGGPEFPAMKPPGDLLQFLRGEAIHRTRWREPRAPFQYETLREVLGEYVLEFLVRVPVRRE